jgi:anti-sigma regulatory factor (Ser/Thr protein kinase)
MTEIRRELPASPAAGRAARRALNGWLTDLVGEQTANDVRLGASELIDNAVLHGGLGPEDVIVLSGVATPDIVRIYVEQPTPVGELHPVGMGERAATEGGFGLRLVQALATNWGISDDRPGEVWFEVDRDIR